MKKGKIVFCLMDIRQDIISTSNWVSSPIYSVEKLNKNTAMEIAGYPLILEDITYILQNYNGLTHHELILLKGDENTLRKNIRCIINEYTEREYFNEEEG